MVKQKTRATGPRQTGKVNAANTVQNPAGAHSLRVLFAASEVYPLIKTGGLADVACYLPLALHELGHDVRIIMPAYRSVLSKINGLRPGKYYRIEYPGLTFRLLRGQLPGSKIPLYLVDIPELFDRRGDPYRDPSGRDWPDNARRFAAFGSVITTIQHS